MGELPSPRGGLFAELAFRRLLASCEDIVAGKSRARPDLHDSWRGSPVFHHYVETLQEQLSDLGTTAGGRISQETLEAYEMHVAGLARDLNRPDMPAFCSSATTQLARGQHLLPGTAGAAGGRPGPAASTATQTALVLRPVPVARTPQLQVAPAGPRAAQADAPGAAQPDAQVPARDPATESKQSRLRTQQQLHEDLTEELAGLAARLKDNTLAVEGKLQERGALLEVAEAALDTSLQHTRDSKQRATAIHQRGRANFCLTCLVMLVVGLLFAGMYIFIKVTRFAGYRAPLASPAAGPAHAGPSSTANARLDSCTDCEQHDEM